MAGERITRRQKNISRMLREKKQWYPAKLKAYPNLNISKKEGRDD